MTTGTTSNPCRRFPLVLAVLVTWTAITLFGTRLIYSGEISLDEVVVNGVAWQLVAAVVFLVVVIRLCGWKDLGLRGPLPGTLKLLWLPMIILLLMAALAVLVGLPPASVMLMVLFNTALVGFSEEVMFRGIFYSRLRDRFSIWPAIIWTSVIFGSVHVLNGFLTGEFGAASVQAMTAAISGLIFIAIRLRTGSLWIAIVYHALWDWILFVAMTGSGAAAPEQAADTASNPVGAMFLPMLVVLPNAIYALWLLRHVGRSLPPGDPKAN